MNVQHVLLFCFTAALYPGNIRRVTAQVYVYTAAEGANGTLACYPSTGGNTKFLCKNRCEAEDIIIKTENNAAQRGRFSMKFTKKSSGGDLDVTFTRLTPSDAGLYRFGLGKASVPEDYCDIDVRVSDSPLLDANSFVRTITEGETFEFTCLSADYRNSKFLCRNDCNKQEDVLIQTNSNGTNSGRYHLEYKEVFSGSDGLYVTIKRAIKSDSGRYTCGYGSALSPDSKNSFQIMVIDAPTTPKPSWNSAFVLVLVLLVVVVIIVLVVVVMILYKKKTRRNVNNSGHAAMEFQASRVYENVDPAPACGESVYQDLQLDSRDPNQIYSTLNN